MRQPDWVSKCGNVRLYNADLRDVLPLAESVATCVTDPPYDLTAGKKGGSGPASVNLDSPYGRARITTGFMGKKWDGTGVAFDPATWVKVLDSLLPGAMLLAFGGSRTYHRMTCAIEDAGFEIRDCLMWMYGQGFPKSLDISKAIDKAAGVEREVVATGKPVKRMVPGADQNRDGWIKDNGREFVPQETAPATAAAVSWDGYGTALKPAYEPIVLAMKPLDGTFAENAQKHGVAGLNVDGCRIPAQDNKTFTRAAGDRCREQYRTGTTTGPSQPTDTGRWPANVIHDGSDEVVSLFPIAPGQQRSVGPRHGEKSSVNVYGDYGPREQFNPRGDFGSAARFFYCPKASAADRRGSKHPTVKPVSLLEYLCKLTMMPNGGGAVIDPFMGSGTTMEACIRLGRPFVGIEQDKDSGYFADCIARAEAALKERKSCLF